MLYLVNCRRELESLNNCRSAHYLRQLADACVDHCCFFFESFCTCPSSPTHQPLPIYTTHTIYLLRIFNFHSLVPQLLLPPPTLLKYLTYHVAILRIPVNWSALSHSPRTLLRSLSSPTTSPPLTRKPPSIHHKWRSPPSLEAATHLAVVAASVQVVKVACKMSMKKTKTTQSAPPPILPPLWPLLQQVHPSPPHQISASPPPTLAQHHPPSNHQAPMTKASQTTTT